MFSKGTQQFDFVKRNIIQKLAYKVKYINQINDVFLEIRAQDFFKISWLDCEQYRINQYKKKEHKHR